MGALVDLDGDPFAEPPGKAVGGDTPTLGEIRDAQLAGREVELSAEQRALGEKLKKALARAPKLAEQQQEAIETVDRLSPRRRRVFSRINLSMGSRLLRGRPHGHAPRNTSRLNNGRTRRPTRRVTSTRSTRSGARSSPSDSADGSEPADGSAHQLDLARSSRRRAS